MPNEIERLNERIRAANGRADYFERECEQLRIDVRDLTQINDGHEETIVRLMEAFNCPNPNAIVEHIQALFEMLENELRIARRVELTGARMGTCLPEREAPYVDETMFVEDAAPPVTRHGLQEARAGIAHVKDVLRGYGVEVEDLAGDE